MDARHQQGFTYVALLIIVAVIGAGLAAKGVSWKNAGQREKEAELLFIGQEFREAIALYYFRSPGPAQDYPKSLEELTADTRFSNTQRYLRRIYRDPMTGQPNWGLVLSPSGRIMGVHSLSREKPLKTANFSGADQEFSGSGSYSDWRFVFVPTATVSIPAQTGSPR